MRFPRTIGWRIFATFTALLVALTALFSLIGLKFVQSTIKDNAGNELRLLSVVLSRQVQRQLGRIEDSLTSMESHGLLVTELRKAEPDVAVVDEFLQTRLKMLPLFKDLAVYDRAGRIVGSTAPAWLDLPARQRPFFKNGLKGFNFSDMLHSEEGRVQLVSAPISDGTYTRGVLVGQVNLSSIYDLMDEKLGVSETTEAFLIDAQLRFVTPGRRGDASSRSHLVETPLARHLTDEFWVDTYRGMDGQEVLGTVLKISGREWYVVVERDMAEVVQPVSDIKKVIIVAAILITLALIVTTFLLTRSITRPLMTLVEGTQRIAKGDVARPIAVPKGGDEVAFLAAEIERMRAKISAFQESLMERLEESERKRIDNERLAAIGTLASTMAHEIRNPLNAMSLLLSRLELARSPTGMAESVMRGMRGEIARLDRLVSDILDYARPLSLQCRDVDVRRVLESTIDIYRGCFEDRGIECRLTLPQEPLKLSADADKLKQCFVNVVQNAVDAVNATGEGGVIDITARRESASIEIAMTDDGVGLPPSAEGRLFDLFFTTKENGTGLGLSTVKKIVDAHGGQVRIRDRAASLIGSGTEVRLSFPTDSQF